MVSVRVMQEKLQEEKNKYQEAVHTVAEGITYSINLESTTFNIVLPAWGEQVQDDILLTDQQKRDHIESLLDFIGQAAARYQTPPI